MSDQRTKVRLAVSEFQSALRTVVNAEREFARAQDQLEDLIDDLIDENERLRKMSELRHDLNPRRDGMTTP